MRELVRRAVMIVEDDPGILGALGDLLEDQGYLVLRVPSAVEAIGRLREGPVPALLIVDLMMPAMDGRELCARLRQDPELSDIPVVMISADPRLGERAGDVEADDYMTKPLDVPRLMSTVAAHCGVP